MLKISKPSIFFPGGYVYVQPETGFSTNANSLLAANAKALLLHRRGNKLPRSTMDECVEDIVWACCQRHPGLCQEVGSAAQQIPAPTGVRVMRNAPIKTGRTVKKCGSCGGRKKK